MSHPLYGFMQQVSCHSIVVLYITLLGTLYSCITRITSISHRHYRNTNVYSSSLPFSRIEIYIWEIVYTQKYGTLLYVKYRIFCKVKILRTTLTTLVCLSILTRFTILIKILFRRPKIKCNPNFQQFQSLANVERNDRQSSFLLFELYDT